MPNDSRGGVNNALHMNIHAYNHLFLWSFGLCYHTEYVYMKIEKGSYCHVYSYTQR